MKIYLDVIWLLNFCFDSLLLLLTAFILKRQVKKEEYAGGFIGSAIVLLMFTPVSPFVEHPAGKMAFSVVIVLAAFGFKRFRYFFKICSPFISRLFSSAGE